MQDDKRLTLIGHLEELRYRIIVCLIVFILCSIISFRYAKEILDFLAKPVEQLIFIYPMELFLVYLKIAFIGGIILASPVIFYQIWIFISSGLYPQEKKYVRLFFPLSLVLFFLGLVFSYFFVLPLGIRFLLSFSTDKIIPMFSVGRYFSFVGMLVFSTGIVFETPVVVLFLTKVGLVNPYLLRRKWKYMMVMAFILAAVITPTVDVFTQCFLAIPMIFLYEISIWLSKLVWNKNKLSS
ncbi:MAG: twin-arginine translocase subunit TatC [Candidatus Omnitrophica bacterium]|nr:twin-arginine translocase subunit TatC [Candidatus Omnitrophota bacterium]